MVIQNVTWVFTQFDAFFYVQSAWRPKLCFRQRVGTFKAFNHLLQTALNAVAFSLKICMKTVKFSLNNQSAGSIQLPIQPSPEFGDPFPGPAPYRGTNQGRETIEADRLLLPR